MNYRPVFVVYLDFFLVYTLIESDQNKSTSKLTSLRFKVYQFLTFLISLVYFTSVISVVQAHSTRVWLQLGPPF